MLRLYKSKRNNNMTTDQYKEKYRVPTVRWSDWDFRAKASYFVTICTANRERRLGEIANGEMTMSVIGQRAYYCWTLIPGHFPFALLGAFVIMPNHVHGIILIDKPDDIDLVETLHATSPIATFPNDEALRHDEMLHNETLHDETLHVTSLRKNKKMQGISPKSHSLSAIVRSYKSAVTQYANIKGIPFAWQTRFYDRIIRDYDELNQTERYIDTNIYNWYDDELYENIPT